LNGAEQKILSNHSRNDAAALVSRSAAAVDVRPALVRQYRLRGHIRPGGHRKCSGPAIKKLSAGGGGIMIRLLEGETITPMLWPTAFLSAANATATALCVAIALHRV
jgi:hypothetical protein